MKIVITGGAGFIGSALILLLITIAAPKAIGSSLDRSPWVDTRDAWLRADIERLARASIIHAPINIWPLMWASIIKPKSRSWATDLRRR